MRKYTVLYSKDVGKKRKVFNDGTLRVSSSERGCALALLDADGKEIRHASGFRGTIGEGEEFQLGQFVVQVESACDDDTNSTNNTTNNTNNTSNTSSNNNNDKKDDDKQRVTSAAQSRAISQPAVKKMPRFAQPVPVQQKHVVAVRPRPDPTPTAPPQPAKSEKRKRSDEEAEAEREGEQGVVRAKAEPRSVSSSLLGSLSRRTPSVKATRAPQLDSQLQRAMKDHQIAGAQFLLQALAREPSSGAVLADEMGLGKTLTAISVVFAFAQCDSKSVVVAPSSLLDNWLNEFRRWLGVRISVVTVKSGSDGASTIQTFSISRASKFPVLLISYDLFRKHAALLNQVPSLDLLVCDEGHRLKNVDGTKTFAALEQCKARKRIVLTGTPIQNNSDELFALLNFVSPNDASVHELKIMFKEHVDAQTRSDCTGEAESAFQSLLSRLVLRRTQLEILPKVLPPRRDFSISCFLNEEQAACYDNLAIDTLQALGVDADRPDASWSTMLPALMQLRRICVLGNAGDAVSGSSSSLLSLPGRQNSQRTPVKLKVLESLLRHMHRLHPEEKVVIVSAHLPVLNRVEAMLRSHCWGWFRLDGGVAVDERQAMVDSFNASTTADAKFAFLLSTRAGGVGINLTGANRLVMMDLEWNPAHDKQAMGRVWRQGQTRNVFVYRLQTIGTIEASMMQRQTSKSSLECIFDDDVGVSGEDLDTAQDMRSLIYPLGERIVDILRNSVTTASDECNQTCCSIDDVLQAMHDELGAQMRLKTDLIMSSCESC